jgi:hypothetical protein
MLRMTIEDMERFALEAWAPVGSPGSRRGLADLATSFGDRLVDRGDVGPRIPERIPRARVMSAWRPR